MAALTVAKAMVKLGYSKQDTVKQSGCTVWVRADKNGKIVRMAVADRKEIEFFGSSLEVDLGKMTVAQFLELAA